MEKVEHSEQSFILELQELLKSEAVSWEIYVCVEATSSRPEIGSTFRWDKVS